MKSIGTAMLAGVLFSLGVVNLWAAPARALYFGSGRNITRMNPDGTGEVTVIPGAGGNLQLDSPNGHIYYGSAGKVYRGNLDGTGTQQIYSGAAFDDYVVDVANEKIYLARDRTGIFEYDMGSATTLPIYEAPWPGMNLRFPSLHFDHDTSTLYWSQVMNGAVYTPSDIAGVPTALFGFSRGHFGTKIQFDSGTPTVYAIGWSDDGQSSALLIGGLDGSEPVVVDLPTSFSDLEFYAIAIDVEGDAVYYSGSEPPPFDPFGPPPEKGIFRSALDGSGFTLLADGYLGSIAIDTADLGDTEDPVISIISPIGGTTNSQGIGLYGTVSDDTAIATVSWSHDGADQGSVELLDGAFSVPAVTLHPGDNSIEVTATDLVGNTGTSQVTITWEPLRQVTLSTNDSVREGHRALIDTVLESSGEVAGMTFKILYDPERFEAPQLEFGEAIADLAPSANSLTAGEISVTFASATETVPAGEQVLVSTRLRARSLESSSSTDLSIQIEDMADSGGNPITVGTYSGQSSIEAIGRTFTGDINSNDRLDTGDASRMQSMLTGASEKRAWDETLNDFNSTSSLDSGDVIRVLRAVVEIDPQPSLPQARGGRSSSGDDPDAPRAVLALSANHASPGETVTLNVILENVTSAFSGASFTLDYPSDLIRLETSSAHSPGSLVAGDSFLLWNLSPAQNDYAAQDGSIRFGASSPADWPGSASGGSIAEFEFTVTSEIGTKALWPITIRDLEISTDSGFEIIPAIGTTASWVTSPQTFSNWQAVHFTPAELEDPHISGASADADADGFANAAEYFSGTDPKGANSRPLISPQVISSDDGGQHCLAISYQRAPWATAASATLQISTGLTDWQDADDISTSSTTDYAAGVETVTAQLDPTSDGGSQYARLKIELAE